MKKDNTIKESTILVIVMILIIALFTIVGYWDSIGERQAKDKAEYYKKADAMQKKMERQKKESFDRIGTSGGVNDFVNPKTKLSDLEKERGNK